MRRLLGHNNNLGRARSHVIAPSRAHQVERGGGNLRRVDVSPAINLGRAQHSQAAPGLARDKAAQDMEHIGIKPGGGKVAQGEHKGITRQGNKAVEADLSQEGHLPALLEEAVVSEPAGHVRGAHPGENAAVAPLHGRPLYLPAGQDNHPLRRGRRRRLSLFLLQEMKGPGVKRELPLQGKEPLPAELGQVAPVIGTAQDPLLQPGPVAFSPAAGPAGFHDKGAVLGVAPRFAAMRKVMVPGGMGSEGDLYHGAHRLRRNADMLPVAGELRRADHLLHGDNGPLAGGQGAVGVAHKGQAQDRVPLRVCQPAVNKAQIGTERLDQADLFAAEGVFDPGKTGQVVRQRAAGQGAGGKEGEPHGPGGKSLGQGEHAPLFKFDFAFGKSLLDEGIGRGKGV